MSVQVKWKPVSKQDSAIVAAGYIGRGIEVARVYHNQPWADTFTAMADLPGMTKKVIYTNLADAQAHVTQRVQEWFRAVEAIGGGDD